MTWGRAQTDCYIDLFMTQNFLTTLWFHFQCLYVFASLTRSSEPGSAVGRCLHRALAGRPPWLIAILWLPAYMISQRLSVLPVPPSSGQPTHFLPPIYTGASSVEKSMIDGSVKGQYTTISQIIQVRRKRHGRFCWRDIILWTTTNGLTSSSEPAKTYICGCLHFTYC